MKAYYLPVLELGSLEKDFFDSEIKLQQQSYYQVFPNFGSGK